LQKSSGYAISRIILIVVVAIIIVLATLGGFFLIGENNSTNTSVISSTSANTQTTTSSSISNSSSTSSQKYNLPYLKSSNTVTITLTILNNASSVVNFNDTNFGAMEIFVPANSNLNLTLDNVQQLPHNLVIVQNNTDVPNSTNVGKDGSVILAIAATTTNYFYVGKSTGSYSDNFSNISPGTYWLACGTRGHAAAGLWVDLFASSFISTPYVVITNPQLRPSGFN